MLKVIRDNYDNLGLSPIEVRHIKQYIIKSQKQVQASVPFGSKYSVDYYLVSSEEDVKDMEAKLNTKIDAMLPEFTDIIAFTDFLAVTFVFDGNAYVFIANKNLLPEEFSL